MDAAGQAAGRLAFDRLDTARYVAAMGRELAELARPHPELGLLAYLLDVALLEAAEQIAQLSGRRTRSAGPGQERQVAGRVALDQAREFQLDQDKP